MMKCDSCEPQLSAYIDGELAADTHDELKNHLDQCEVCRRQLDDLREIDVELQRLALPESGVERVIAALNQVNDHSTRPDTAARFPSFGPWALVAAVAACTLLVLAMNPSMEPRKQIIPVVATPVAGQLVRATGSVEVLPPGAESWHWIESTMSPSVQNGSRIRTSSSVACEIETADETLIRMNSAAELILHEANRMEVVEGQVWCRAPQRKPFHVDILDPFSGSMPALMTMTCPEDSEYQWTVSASQSECQSLSKAQAEIGGPDFRCPVGPGESVVVKGDQQVERRNLNATRATLWQLPLLAVTPTSKDELRRRLEPILIGIGSTKVGYLTEQQIRRLGPSGAIPLLAYVQSADPINDQEPRRTAMRIATEVVDQTAMTRLQELTRDRDSVVAQLAEDAVKRLQEPKSD
ncbi:MAG: anti-sigma factor family protein [Rubripirellula sp.]